MNLKHSAILITAGIIVGIVIALLAQSAGTLSAGRSETPAIPAADTIKGMVSDKNLSKFVSPADELSFLRTHTDPAGNYPNLPAITPESPTLIAPAYSNNTRTWSFDVDTSTFKPDEYLVTASAVLYEATGTALFNVLEPGTPIPYPQNLQGQMVSTGPGDVLRINSLGDHYVGEKFTITGTTNLPKDADILVTIYSSSFKPTDKSQSGEFSGATGTIKVSGSQRPATAPGVTGERSHSDTNVQVEGVDEADIIKTDGNYLYVVTGNSLKILTAYPPETAGIIATRGFSGKPIALYSAGDRLALIASDSGPADSWDCGSGNCRANVPTKYVTKIYLFSVRDHANPEIVRKIEIEGQYKDSRMIGSELFFMTTLVAGSSSENLEFPDMRDSIMGTSVLPLYYFDRKDRAFSVTTIGAVDIAKSDIVHAQAFLIGSAGTIYVSPNHLDIAISSYDNGGTRPTTDIYSFVIERGLVSFAAKGTVVGTLLNQFSMDEYNGNLRVATTVQDWWSRGGTTYSQVSILDKDMKVLGVVDNIAPTEKIYAARFLGNRLYLVTFRQTDPFYVIDLSNPQEPRILGELKIPGFSDYLHPYDDTRIIGIGKESANGALKMALFDVSDVHHPQVIAEERIGEAGSDSEALRDHKAFLFDKEKDLLVLPVSLVVAPVYRPDRPSSSYGPTWGGAYVYSVDPSHGFNLRGTVEHYSGAGKSHLPVLRSLYIEDTLYTMSPDSIVMSDLKDKIRRIGSINLQ